MTNKLKYYMPGGDPVQKIRAEAFVDNQSLVALKQHLEKKIRYLYAFLIK